MSQIEAATSGVCAREPELKTSRKASRIAVSRSAWATERPGNGCGCAPSARRPKRSPHSCARGERRYVEGALRRNLAAGGRPAQVKLNMARAGSRSSGRSGATAQGEPAEAGR